MKEIIMLKQESDYKIFLEDIKHRKGSYFIEALENSYNKIISLNADKFVSNKQKYQLYWLEANVRWHFYWYLEKIERSFITTLKTKNETLKREALDNLAKLDMNIKMWLISGNSDIKNHDWVSKAKALNISHLNHNDQFLKYLKLTKIFKEDFKLDIAEQQTIRRVRNAIHHFDFIFEVGLEKTIKDFINLFSKRFQQILSVYILTEIIQIITKHDFMLKIVNHLNESWMLFNDEISKEILSKLKTDYKSSTFFKLNPDLVEYNKKRKIENKEIILEKDWLNYCQFQFCLEIAKEYKGKIRNKIFTNTIKTLTKRSK